jgi:hypothetical protein
MTAIAVNAIPIGRNMINSSVWSQLDPKHYNATGPESDSRFTAPDSGKTTIVEAQSGIRASPIRQRDDRHDGSFPGEGDRHGRSDAA